MTSTAHWWGPYRLLNVASNAAFPLVGVGIALDHGTGKAWAFAAAMTALGLGSGAYHWKRTPARQALDWFSMLAVLLTLDTVAADASGLNIHWWMLAIGFGGAGLLVYALDMVGEDALLGLAVFLAMLPPMAAGGRATTLAILSLAVFLAAKWAHNEDRHAGRHYLHSVWHDLAAVAFGLLFLANVVGG